jgi:osmotically-inducible protein OsmY
MKTVIHRKILGALFTSTILVSISACDNRATGVSQQFSAQSSWQSSSRSSSQSSWQSSSQSSSESTTLTTSVDPADTELANQIQSALSRDEITASLSILLLVSEGDVRLTGVVDNQLQLDQVIKVVKSVNGVRNIDDQLSLKQ